jgi:hypothetical protein
VAAALTFAGSRFAGVLAGPRDSALYRLVLYSLAGWVGLHLLLTALGLAGLPWRLPVVLAALAAAVALAWRWLPAPDGRTRLPSDLGWGEALALASLAVFTACALSGWIATPDFIYHWGIKGHRFYLSGGVDYRYLGASWNWVIHPDYPNLLPGLFAVTALAAGRFDEPAMMLWSAVAFALLLAAVREALRRAGTRRFVAQAALAGLAMALGAYGIGGLSAGGADWLIALALAAAMPPLLSPADLRGAAQIGLAAAFAASSKVEGLPLGVILIGIYTVQLWQAMKRAPAAGDGACSSLRVPTACRRSQGTKQVPVAGDRGLLEASIGSPPATPRSPSHPSGGEGDAPSPSLRRPVSSFVPAPRPLRRRRREIPRAALALTLPLAAVALPWLVAVWRHHLFAPYNSGPLELERLPRVLAAIAATLQGSWSGFGYLLLLLPLVALDRRLRPLAAVIFLQLLFYLYVYLSVRVDAVTLVATSFSRLILHVLPAVLTGAAIALDELDAVGPTGATGAIGRRRRPARDLSAGLSDASGA